MLFLHQLLVGSSWWEKEREGSSHERPVCVTCRPCSVILKKKNKNKTWLYIPGGFNRKHQTAQLTGNKTIHAYVSHESIFFLRVSELHSETRMSPDGRARATAESRQQRQAPLPETPSVGIGFGSGQRYSGKMLKKRGFLTI